METAGEIAGVARTLFVASLPLALAALLAMWGLVRRHPYDATLS